MYRDTQRAAKLEAEAASSAILSATTSKGKGKHKSKKGATGPPSSDTKATAPSPGDKARSVSDTQHSWRAAAVALAYTAYETLWKGCRGCWGAVERLMAGVTGAVSGKGEL